MYHSHLTCSQLEGYIKDSLTVSIFCIISWKVGCVLNWANSSLLWSKVYTRFGLWWSVLVTHELMISNTIRITSSRIARSASWGRKLDTNHKRGSGRREEYSCYCYCIYHKVRNNKCRKKNNTEVVTNANQNKGTDDYSEQINVKDLSQACQ